MRLNEVIEGFGRQMAANGRSNHIRVAYLRYLQALSRRVPRRRGLDALVKPGAHD